jgi:hypothetical protein
MNKREALRFERRQYAEKLDLPPGRRSAVQIAASIPAGGALPGAAHNARRPPDPGRPGQRGRHQPGTSPAPWQRRMPRTTHQPPIDGGPGRTRRCHRILIGALSSGEALDLLVQVPGPAHDAEEPDAAARMCEVCRYLPLALRIAAERASARERSTVRDAVGARKALLRDRDWEAKAAVERVRASLTALRGRRDGLRLRPSSPAQALASLLAKIEASYELGPRRRALLSLSRPTSLARRPVSVSTGRSRTA